VFRVSFSNQPAGFSEAQLEQFYFSSPDGKSSAEYWAYQSHAEVDLDGDVVSVQLDFPAFSQECDAAGSYGNASWRIAAKEEARVLGIEPDDYDLYAFVWPVVCPNAGRASGSSHYIADGASAFTAAHETGHNLVIGHSNAMFEGQFVKYGGLSVMGFGWSDATPVMRYVRGWIDPSRISTVGGTGRYALAPLDTAEIGAPQILVVPKSGAVPNRRFLSTRIAQGPYDSDLGDSYLESLHVGLGSTRLDLVAQGGIYVDAVDGMTLDKVTWDGTLLEFDLTFPTECVAQAPSLALSTNVVHLQSGSVAVPVTLTNNDPTKQCSEPVEIRLDAAGSPGVTVALDDSYSLEPGESVQAQVIVTVSPRVAEGSSTLTLRAVRDDLGLSSGDEALLVVVDRTPPPVPTDLVADVSVGYGDWSVQLTWTTAWVSDPEVVVERIYRDGVLIGSVFLIASWTDTEAPGGVRVRYEVTSVDSAGNESLPSEVAFAYLAE
jgi:hypothetical protein